MQLGFKARAARAALDEACAHVGTDADIPTLVKAVLDTTRQPATSEEPTDLDTEAKQALVQLGYPSGVAAAAVIAARAHVGTGVELQVLIKEALRRCHDA
jgi:Holliday junction resolvasome RuvABC DNA-binding subunit